MTAKARYRTEFGATVSDLLAVRRMTQVDLASSANCSPSYVNQTFTGSKAVTPGWADLVANALGLPPEERTKLHRAAGNDLLRAKGYKLTLDLNDPY